MKICPAGAELFHADGRTDRQDVCDHIGRNKKETKTLFYFRNIFLDKYL